MALKMVTRPCGPTMLEDNERQVKERRSDSKEAEGDERWLHVCKEGITTTFFGKGGGG